MEENLLPKQNVEANKQSNQNGRKKTNGKSDHKHKPAHTQPQTGRQPARGSNAELEYTYKKLLAHSKIQPMGSMGLRAYVQQSAAAAAHNM